MGLLAACFDRLVTGGDDHVHPLNNCYMYSDEVNKQKLLRTYTDLQIPSEAE